MQPKDLMIYSDMDGTLLSSWERGPIISLINEKAIRKFIHEGGLFSIATGRNLKNGPSYLKNFDVRLPMILVNGALIYDPSQNRIIRKTLIHQTFILEALDYFIKSKRVAVVISDSDEVYHVNHPSISDSDLPYLDFETIGVKLSDVLSLEVLKITFVINPEDRDQIEKDIKTFKTGSKVSMSFSSKRFIEIVSTGINKAEAIGFLKPIELPSNRILVCIGDYANDSEMLDLADIAAVPENGLEKLKKPGRLITVDHDHDAIADLIHQLSVMQ